MPLSALCQQVNTCATDAPLDCENKVLLEYIKNNAALYVITADDETLLELVTYNSLRTLTAA